MPDKTDTWLTPEQVAERLQVSERTLTDWRYKGFGPPFTKLGPAKQSPVCYKSADVDQWLRDNTGPERVS